MESQSQTKKGLHDHIIISVISFEITEILQGNHFNQLTKNVLVYF